MKIFNYRPRLTVAQFFGKNDSRRKSKPTVSRSNRPPQMKFLEQKIKLVVDCIGTSHTWFNCVKTSDSTCQFNVGGVWKHRNVTWRLCNPNADLVAAKHGEILRAGRSDPKVMGSPRLHSRWVDVIALLFGPLCSDSMFVFFRIVNFTQLFVCFWSKSNTDSSPSSFSN